MQAAPAPLPSARAAVTARLALLEGLIATVLQHFNAQFGDFTTRLAGALVDAADMDGDIRVVQLRIRAGNLLRNQHFAFLHLAAAALEKGLRLEFAQLGPKAVRPPEGEALSLVPYEVMDEKVTLAAVCKPFDLQYSDTLATLNVRLAFMMDRAILRAGQNPFRPEVFIAALQQAWLSFNAEEEAAGLLLSMLKPGLMLELAPLYQALNLSLQRKGVLPGDVERARSRRSDSHDASGARKRQQDDALADQLRQLFARGSDDALAGMNLDLPAHALGPSDPNAPPPPWAAAASRRARDGVARQAPRTPSAEDADGPAPAGGAYVHIDSAAREHLMAYLGWMQREAPRAETGQAAVPHNVIYLPAIKQGAPRGTLTHADESTIDLLTAVFETVFRDQNIAREIRELVLLLQVPVLKAALADKDFFFQESHPARRLIELLSKMGWEQRKDSADPLYQAMQRSVERIGRDGEQVFTEAVDELEQTIRQDEQAAEQAIAGPIAAALKQEKHTAAQRSARDAVAMRIGSGEVVAVVEAFLENKWTDVLTLAYTVDEEKPGAVRHATAAMDELIWSVKPKITPQERKDLIGKLPGLLARLNKWLDAIKWQDAERLRFFAELAECHASIVRAPVELSPERQLELSMQAAQLAAERREAIKERQMEAKDEDAGVLAGLARGMWLEFEQEGAQVRKVKLAWVSPLRTLFIFSTGGREEAFTLSGEDLARSFDENKVRIASTGGVVGRALSQALGAADNDEIRPSAASSM
jgi:hypothetical protein